MVQMEKLYGTVQHHRCILIVSIMYKLDGSMISARFASCTLASSNDETQRLEQREITFTPWSSPSTRGRFMYYLHNSVTAPRIVPICGVQQ